MRAVLSAVRAQAIERVRATREEIHELVAYGLLAEEPVPALTLPGRVWLDTANRW
jgi:hypothetical protein